MATKNVKTNDEVKRLIIMVAIVTILFLIFYVITLIITKEEPIEEVKTPATIQYDEIILGNLLKQPNDEYYVLVKINDDVYVPVYETLLQNYSKQENSIRYYTSILDKVFNLKFKDSESNLDVDDIMDLKVKESTLFKIKDKEIVSTYEGKEEIVKYLKSLMENNKEG